MLVLDLFVRSPVLVTRLLALQRSTSILVMQCLVCLELISTGWLVHYKTFAIGTEGFLPPGFLDLVATTKGGDISSWRGVLLVRLIGLSGSARCHKCIHLLQHGIHVCIVHCLHLHNLLCVLVLQIANSIACVLPSFSAAAVSCASSAASLNCDCFAVIAEYCFHSRYFSVKYVWSATHICTIAPLFSQTTIWSSVNISDCNICAPTATVFSSLLIPIPRLPSKT
jgi:hypothetical protein